MSIIDTYDPATDTILKPTHFSKPVEGFPEAIIVTFTRNLLNTFLQNYNFEAICNFFDGRGIYQTTYKGKSLALFRTSVGAPITVAALEETIVKGARKILIFGSCGTLDSSITDENIVVPTFAYRDEGTSYHYAPADAGDFIEVKTSERMAEILEEMGIPVVKGKTWTTDALYRETHRNMELRKKAGCITVEMECASVMAMAQFRGVEAYQFLYASDNLDSAEWEQRALMTLPATSRERFAYMAMEAAVKL